MPQDVGGFGPDQVHQRPVLLGRGQARQLRAAAGPARSPFPGRPAVSPPGPPASACRTSARSSIRGLLRRSVNGGANRAQSTSATVTWVSPPSSTRPRACDQQFRVHQPQAPPPQLLRALAVGHPAAAPRPPRHRRRRQAPAPPGLGQRVQVARWPPRTRLAAAAPGGRDRGEQDEPSSTPAVSSSRYAAPAALAPVTAASSARLVSASIVLWADARGVHAPRPAAGRPRRSGPAAPRPGPGRAVSHAITAAPTPEFRRRPAPRPARRPPARPGRTARSAPPAARRARRPTGPRARRSPRSRR